ncbi:MAG TPA: hypothetical protein PK625_04420 [Spirochaetales bacterium]|nr:hypothetical protein [Spirochaetales bacterium]HPE36371.1 hypothetical protein [Spirochaetales bacterium]
MKRALVIAAILALGTAPLLAQTAAGSTSTGSGLVSPLNLTADLYPVRVDVVRIYGHADGYKVVYRKGGTEFAEVYIPIGWFTAGGKAQLLLGRGPERPYMVVYYREDGSFSHVKLYALQNITDSSWGEMTGDPGDVFSVDSIKLEF